MIPRTNEEVSISVNLSKLDTPDAASVEYPGWLGIIHEHSNYFWHHADWICASQLLDREQRATLDRDRRAATARDFEDLLDELFEDDFLAGSGCDFGVGAAVWALNAAGCVTASSCSGHGDGGPNVLLACDPNRAQILMRLASESGCGLENVEGGLQHWAPSIQEVFDFTERLIADRAAFDTMPLPAPRLTSPPETELTGYDDT